MPIDILTVHDLRKGPYTEICMQWIGKEKNEDFPLQSNRGESDEPLTVSL